jgi:hypothetical protein
VNRFMILLLLSLSLLPMVAEAALPVEEVGPNLVANQTSAVNNTITAIESVIQSGYMLLELTALGELVLNGASWMDDLARLEEIVHLSHTLAWDLSSVEAQFTALFALEGAPVTSVALAQRASEIRIIITQSYGYAMRAQTLMTSALHTVTHMLALLEAVGALIGNLQGHQTLGQTQLKLTQLLAEQAVITSTFQRAQTVDAMTQPLMQESLRRINEHMMADHPR